MLRLTARLNLKTCVSGLNQPKFLGLVVSVPSYRKGVGAMPTKLPLYNVTLRQVVILLCAARCIACANIKVSNSQIWCFYTNLQMNSSAYPPLPRMVYHQRDTHPIRCVVYYLVGQVYSSLSKMTG